MINSNNILATMTKVANILATGMKNRTSGGNYPKGLSSSVFVEPAKQIAEGRYSVSVIVKHPAGAAYEFGSGERGLKKAPYPITPKKAGALAFIWIYPSPLGRKLTEGDEFVLLQKVMHPGVEARPYARPELQARKTEIAKQLGTAFKASISILGGKYTEEIK